MNSLRTHNNIEIASKINYERAYIELSQGNINKSLALINNKTLLEITYGLVKKQLKNVVVNSNLNLKKKIKSNLEIIPDSIPGFLGPLSGILSGMQFAKKEYPKCKWLVSFPVDSIFFPSDFVEKMINRINNEPQIVCATSNGRAHPVFAIWSLNLIDDLENALVEEGVRKIDEWTKRYNLEFTNFQNKDLDPFFNINTKEDLKFATEYLNS